MEPKFKRFCRIWVYDFEFIANPGEIPKPVCMVAREIIGKKTVRFWFSDGDNPAPFDPTSDSDLFCAYYASAEVGCHLALGWPIPKNTLDLFTEFRVLTNGLPMPGGNGLVGAMKYFRLEPIDPTTKEAMRSLVLRGGPWTKEEVASIIVYCESDVTTTEQLFHRIAPFIDLGRALFRGRYMASVAKIENTGIPIDTGTLTVLNEQWEQIQESLIKEVDESFGVYEAGTFKMDQWKRYLHRNEIAWPYLESGNLNMCEETFSDMAKRHPQLLPIKELRATLSKMRLSTLQVGRDGRNRCLLSPFSSKTSRNQPSTTKYIFGPAKWFRSLIKPEKGMAIAYIDWSQQEFGIAAALSRDENMMTAYRSGDAYLAFAKQVGGIPADGTKESHRALRDLYKECILGVQYSMGEEALALRIGKSPSVAGELLKAHKMTYSRFWLWVEAAVDKAMIDRELPTVFGWKINIGYDSDTSHRSLRNFPMQANGAEMLRIACVLAHQKNISICATVHDAVLIEATCEEIDAKVTQMCEVMEQASQIVLSGFSLRTDVHIIRYPDRYFDEKGKEMWERVIRIANNFVPLTNRPSTPVER